MATVSIGDWGEKNVASIGNLSDGSSFTGLQKVVAQEIVNGADLTGYDGFESGSSQLGWESASNFSIDGNREVYGVNSLQVSSSNQNVTNTKSIDTIFNDNKIVKGSVKLDNLTGNSSDNVSVDFTDLDTFDPDTTTSLVFKGDGSIEFAGNSVTSFSGNEIIDWEVKWDFTNGTADVIINGVTEVSNASVSESEINEIGLKNGTTNSGGTVNAFFDRLTYTNNGADTVNAGGPVIFSETAWNNITGNDGVVVTESDETTTRPFEIEGDPANNDSAWLWVYGSWDSDGSDQAVVAAGSGDGTNYASGGTGANPWGQTGINAEMVQHLNDDPLTATDSSPKGNNGTVTGATSTTGEFDGAGSFEGTDDEINIPDSSTDSGFKFQNGDYTVVTWVKTPNNTDNLPAIIEQSTYADDADGRDRAPGLFIDSNNNPTHQLDDSVTSGFAIPSVSNIYDGNWHQWVAQRTSDTIEMIFDVDSTDSASVSGINSTISIDTPFRFAFNQFENSYSDIDVDSTRIYSEYKNGEWIQSDFDMSPKGGQTFFTWSGTTTTGAGTATDTAVTTSYTLTPQTSTELNTRLDTATTSDYTYTGQTTQEVNNRFDTAVSTQYSYTANQTVELNNVTDTATTTTYTVTAQTSRDFENFTDTATTAGYTFTAGQTTESQVNVATALTANYTYTAQTSSELVINVDQVQTANYSYTANQSFEQNDVTATAELASYTYTAQVTSEQVDFFDTAVTADYTYTGKQTTEIAVVTETAQTSQYTYTANQTTEFELARIARTTSLDLNIDKNQNKTLSGDIDK